MASLNSQQEITLVALMEDLFRGRRDAYGTWSPASTTKSDRSVKRPLEVTDWVAHLRGKRPLGIYPVMDLVDRFVVAWSCFDVDDEEHPELAADTAQKILQSAMHFEMPVYPESSKGKGFHLWMFYDQPVDAWKATAIMRMMLEHVGLRCFDGGKGNELKIFPKQNDLIKLKLGNYVYVPLFGGAKAGKQVFLGMDLAPIAEQVPFMQRIRKITQAVVDGVVEANSLKPGNVSQFPGLDVPSSDASARKEREPGGFFERSAPESVEALSDVELTNLCDMLPTLRKVRNGEEMNYNQWLGALTHLVPFTNGLDRARELKMGEALQAIDRKRYAPEDLEDKWKEAIKLYMKPDRGNNASVAERLVIGTRMGAREDVFPISHRHGTWNGGFCQRRWNKNSQGVWCELAPTPLTNFTLSVISQENVRGLDSIDRRVKLSGRMASGKILPPADVPAESWKKVGTWLHKNWGTDPIIFNGRANVDLVLESIALASVDAVSRDIYTHTGWVKSKAGWAYLLPDGIHGIPSVAAESLAKDISIETPVELRRYSLPTYPGWGEFTPMSYRFLEEFLDVAPLGITAPLVSSLFLAPLMSFLPIDFGLFVCGETQSRKSSLVANLLSWWGGPFTKANLPVSFDSTMVGIMSVLATAKDLPVVVDNFVPGLDSNFKLMAIARAMGDRSGRTRSGRDLKIRTTVAPQGFPIMTGEDTVQGESSEGRLYTVKLWKRGPNSINNAKLREIETVAMEGKLGSGMAHYLQWLSRQLEDDSFIPGLIRRHVANSRKYQGGAVDGRRVEQAMWLMTGMQLFKESHPTEWSGDVEAKLWETFKTQMILSVQVGKESGLAGRFLDQLFGMLATGELLAPDGRTGDAPGWYPECFGWRKLSDRWQAMDGGHCVKGVVWTLNDLANPQNWWLIVRVEPALAAMSKWSRGVNKIVESQKAVAMALDNAGLCVRRQGERLTAVEFLDGERVYGLRMFGPAVMRFMRFDTDIEKPLDPEAERHEN